MWLQVCCAAFCPSNANLLAIGTASCQARLYDVRRTDAPLATAQASRAVSYVRFHRGHLFASVVNSSILQFDVTSPTLPLVREFRGHVNDRNFVGMAVSGEGYLCSGTERNTVAVYHENVPRMLMEQPISALDGAAAAQADKPAKADQPVVSCVTVSHSAQHIVAGNTTGWVNVMRLE